MANVMLTSETARDPNAPFKLRIEDVCAKFDALASECLLLLQTEEQQAATSTEPATSPEAEVVKKMEHFNSVCDELYKEILRRKEKLLNAMETPKNVDLHLQLQTAGNLVQVMGDFRHFLEAGETTASENEAADHA